VGLFAITAPFVFGVSQEVDGKGGAWISMFSLTNIPLHLSDIMFGDASELTREAPAKRLGDTALALWYAWWTTAMAVTLWWRYRRIR
jgi:hypothetical protein